MPILWDIFLVFAKIGLFTFGGGYAMLSVISESCVDKKKWITADDMMNITVIAETTPGPISINCATFVGYRQAGILGAVAATVGVVMPSFVIIYLISLFLDGFLQYPIVAFAFNGIKIGVSFLILEAAIGMISKMAKQVLPRILMIGATVVMLAVNLLSLKFSSISLMVICAAISFSAYWIANRKGGDAA